MSAEGLDSFKPQCKSKAIVLDCGIPNDEGSVFCKILNIRRDGGRICIFNDKFKRDRSEEVEK